ncbi:MAG: UDP-N-acetylmuramoyl-L-alanyl-D-glutamate--2,6-diaminopimelate ligase [Defluviitaleaceae bacterium]|nr:UDP-N-acetylmuramoyl-L-alanyl-D-glutamate--2,6-diaminopimelate ligase [Defluviitaleaceae bacterium]
MKLRDIFTNIDFNDEDGNIEVLGICIDSRKVGRGDLYVAIKGLHVDGHSFIEDAVARGAVAVLASSSERQVAVPMVLAEDVRLALSQVARRFYGDPAKGMKLVGVTGTNGKTSTTSFVEGILRASGERVGVIGTLGVRLDGERLDMPFATSTTPDTIELFEIIKAMADAGCKYLVMEVSSHALALHKVASLRFDVGIFTNLSQDHLDFHGTMENYRLAKAGLFDISDVAVINNDDEARDFLLEYTAQRCKTITFGIDGGDYCASNCVLQSGGVSYIIKGQSVDVPIAGKFTIYNTLAALAACDVLGIDIKQIANALSGVKGVDGRIQSIPNDRNIGVIVDYAHTPDGLENIITACREFTKGRIITVFGCGGDRDPIKRPIMGEMAGRLSDYCIITSDNPRNENPEEIIAQVEQGMLKSNCKYEKIIDRCVAINTAIDMAKASDCVIIAGKGHETYQEFKNGRRVDFDDAKVAKIALKNA